MTRQALDKMNDKQKYYCETLSVLINRDRKAGKKDFYEKETWKLRGYLESMEDMGVITHYEMQALYLWYFTGDRATA